LEAKKLECVQHSQLDHFLLTFGYIRYMKQVNTDPQYKIPMQNT
jgi:hypothetical protein